MPDPALHSALAKPALVAFAGLPGTGKSTLARLVAERCDAVWLRVDTIEAAILKAGVPQSYETGLAAYIGARDLGEVHLRLRRNVVIDAVNGVEPAREMWRSLARDCHATLSFVVLACSDPVEHRRRVEARSDPTPPLAKPTWLEVVQREFAPWNEPVLKVDSLEAPAANLPRILDYLARDSPERGPRPVVRSVEPH